MFEHNEPIGDGTFSICMKCISIDTNEEYGVKILRSNQNVDAEIAALKQCSGHPNIVNLVEVIKDDAFTYIVTEWLAGKELFKYAQEQTLDECEARCIFKEIVNAVAHMHSQNIAHRDLKLENIKFASEDSCQSNVKILDFGFACRTDEHKDMEGLCYTLDYAAPEVLSNKRYTKACDLWSMGVILYKLLCGHSPFRRPSEADLETPNITDKIMKRIKQSSIDESSKWKSLSEPAKDLIRRLLTVSPHSRITLNEILVHDWLNSTTDVTHKKSVEAAADIRPIATTKKVVDQNQPVKAVKAVKASKSIKPTKPNKAPKTRKKSAKTRNGRLNMKSVSITSTDSATSELDYSKSSSGIGGTSEISDQCNRSTSIESTSTGNNDLSAPYRIDETNISNEMENLNNNNDKYIENGPVDIDCVSDDDDEDEANYIVNISDETLPDNTVAVIEEQKVFSPYSAYLEDQIEDDSTDEDMDSESSAFSGFTKNDESILRFVGRTIDLKVYIHSFIKIEKEFDRAQPNRKRNASTAFSQKSTDKKYYSSQEVNACTNSNSVFQTVPKRLKRQRQADI